LRGQAWQRLDRSHDIVNVGLGVAGQRQGWAAVPGKGLNRLDRRSRPDQRADVVPSQGMEIRHTLVGLVWDASPLKIDANCLGGFVMQR
jgi:hypothetical protein